MTANTGRVLIAALTILAGAVLAFTGAISGELAVGLITGAGGYVLRMTEVKVLNQEG